MLFTLLWEEPGENHTRTNTDIHPITQEHTHTQRLDLIGVQG